MPLFFSSRLSLSPDADELANFAFSESCTQSQRGAKLHSHTDSVSQLTRIHTAAAIHENRSPLKHRNT